MKKGNKVSAQDGITAYSSRESQNIMGQLKKMGIPKLREHNEKIKGNIKEKANKYKKK